MTTKRHKVFTSYHHANDQFYRNKFEKLFAYNHDVIVPQSVQIGDIDSSLVSVDRIRQIIRDEYLRDTTVTVVLIGTETWKRKHVDWEIGSSLRHTMYNSRSGLIGIFLPSYPLIWNNFTRSWEYDIHTIPPRLYDNIENGFATLHKWSTDPNRCTGLGAPSI